ncbi:MAG TPA: hypothetical protein VFJ72_11805 [Rubrobacteraceae bacterium]|nr:hypothetical protein [Rubrobacteraceae bacterium]
MTKTGQIKLFMMATAAALALGLLALLAAKPAEAAFPGNNGKIAFQSDRDGPVEIYAITPGETATRITTSNNSSDPAYSPDGGRIAFLSGNQIFVMNADGSGRRQVTTSSPAKTEPAWSADGTKIAYVSNSFDLDGQTDLEIWTINADGTGRKQLTGNTFPDTQPAWSPDGTKIAFVSARTGDTDRNVYVMNSDGTGQASITPNSPAGCSPNCYQGHDDSPAWSPDGSKIAYVHGYGPPTNPFAGGGVPNIWTMDPAGANKTNVSNNPDTSATQPAWSPDGTQIAYVGVAPLSTDRNIYVMNSDGTGQGPIDTSTAHDINPDWQPVPQCTNTNATTGNDVITGTSGKDVLCGGDGNDVINGAGGNDIILGEAGNDTLVGSLGNDIVNGGSGLDRASYANSATPVRVSLTTNFATGEGSDVFLGIENLTGSNFSDSLIGSSLANLISGVGGADSIQGVLGNDTLSGGLGNDTVVGGAGSDRHLGDSGNDTLNSRDGVNGNDTLNGGTGTDRCVTDTREASIRACP